MGGFDAKSFGDSNLVMPMRSMPSSAVVVDTPTALVLHLLGCRAVWANWQNALTPLGNLERSVQDDVACLQAKGVVLQMQWLDEAVQESGVALEAWGLHSVTLHAPASGPNAWPHGWPLGLQAQDLSRAAVLQALGPPVVQNKAMALLECELGSALRKIGVHCEWAQPGQLVRMTLVRLGDFEPLQPFEYSPPKVAAAQVQAQPVAAQSQITCRSGEITPKTGVYEAHLLKSHPSASYYNTSPNRFYFRQKGQPMIRLGVPDGGESLVVWTWRSDGPFGSH